MKINETSTREQALTWWNNLSLQTQQEITKRTRLAIDSPLIGIGLTGREIEEIWRKETKEDYSDIAEAAKKLSNTIEELRKTNQTQFKQFDESLFKAYISKFSNEDKLKAFNILNDEFAYFSHEQMELVQKQHAQQVKFLQYTILKLSK